MRKVSRVLAWAAHLAIFPVLGLSLLCASMAARAGETSLIVRATILKQASLRVLVQPASVIVTAADIAQGYVDVPAAVQIAIRSNTPDGYMLEFATQGDFMRQILVRGFRSDVQLSPAGGVVTQSSGATGITQTTLTLGFRFLLSEAAQQGAYAWPMHLWIAPL